MKLLEQGMALLDAGRFHEAVQQFGAAVRQEPLAAEARVGLARACLGIGDGWAAAAWLSDACRVAPQRADLWLELAKLLAAQGRAAEVEPLLRMATALHPASVPLLQAQADLYLRGKLYAQALPLYERLYALQPQGRGTLLHYGFCLEQLGEVEQAIVRYREALAVDPDFMEAHVDLAGVLWRVEDFEGSLAHARKAVALAPAHPYAVRMLGTALLNLNRLDEAQAQLRRALDLLPGFSLAEVDLAFALLMAGREREGWAMYARRWRDTDRMKRPAFFRPELEWQGPVRQPLEGKSIAVYAEQGLGDVIQFIRYVPLLEHEGARVHAVIQPGLARLVEHSLGSGLCLAAGHEARVDYHVALLDLPLYFGAPPGETAPPAPPYLRAVPQDVQRWRDRLAPWDGQFKVGLGWSGSGRQVNNNNRAMHLSALLPLLGMAGVQCFSLQKGEAGRFTDVEPPAGRLVDFTAEWTDFADSAALLENLDLVITVDTAVAHLAGALGRPVWVMLGPNADWRWLLGRDDSTWYPTMRLFRRAHGEARSAVVARLMHALHESK